MSRLQLAGAIALAVASTGLFALRCVSDPAIPFVVQSDEAPWIMYPVPPTGQMGLAERDALPVTRFRRRFQLPAGGAPGAQLQLRAMRAFQLSVNGAPVAVGETAPHWRRYRQVALGAVLRPGENELSVAVTNPTGPALLSLRLSGIPQPLRSDASWSVSHDAGPARRAIAVNTDRVNPSSFALPAPRSALATRRDSVLACFVLSALAFLAARSSRARRLAPGLVWGLPLLVTLAWTGLFAGKMLEIPLHVGFDAHHHVKYVEFLRQQGHLPLAADGWMMFHPPVYYAPTAALVELQTTLAPGSASLLAWHLPGFLAGLSSALLCWLLARRIFGAGSREELLAALFAASLPMNLYVSSYVTNESLHAALATAVVLVSVALLREESPRPAGLLLWGVLAALALLTKYTAWIVVGVAGFFLWVTWWRVERAPAASVARRLGLSLAVVLVLAGWFYVRNFAHYGQPFPLNVDLPGETRQWWSQPGYYMPAFFLRFGEVLAHPFLAGTHTAWNSLYATLWGDGQLAGQMDWRLRHRHWDWELMAAGYWLALPVTALLLLGVVRALRLAFRDRDPRRRAVFSFLLTLGYALFFSVLYMTLRMQDYGQAKSFYALASIGPLCICFALGAGAADRLLESRGATWARTLLWGALGSWAGVVWLSFAG